MADVNTELGVANQLKSNNMNIQYGKYRLEPEGRSFNLIKTTDRVSKKGGLVELSMGYGMRFETCIESIITDKLADRDETFTLRQYIDEYKALRTELLET